MLARAPQLQLSSGGNGHCAGLPKREDKDTLTDLDPVLGLTQHNSKVELGCETMTYVLVEVDSAGAVLVHLRDDVLQLLLGQVRVYLAQDLLQDLRADVSLPVFVINPTRKKIILFILFYYFVKILSRCDGSAALTWPRQS